MHLAWNRAESSWGTGSLMSSLTSAPVAEVLEELFADAARTQTAFLEGMAELPPASDEASGGRP
jgi:hypothetical protein